MARAAMGSAAIGR